MTYKILNRSTTINVLVEYDFDGNILWNKISEIQIEANFEKKHEKPSFSAMANPMG